MPTVSRPAETSTGMRSDLGNDGHGAGPVGVGQTAGSLGNIGDQRIDLVEIRNVNDQRVVHRATLGGEDLAHSVPVEGVCAQTVYGFGGDADDLPAGQHCTGLFNRARILGMQKQGIHSIHFLLW